MGRFAVALLLLALGLRAPARAEPAPTPASRTAPAEVTLDEIVVSGSADEEAGPRLGTVEGKNLRRRGDRSAAESLEHEPAINASSGRRGERIFTMRGFEQRQVLVLLDGAPAYAPYDGQVDLGLLPVEMIDHITLVKGPASVLLGPNGMGGAVNIVTRRPGSAPLLSAAVEAGRDNAWQLSGLHSARAGRLGYTLYGGWRRRDAFPLPADFVPTSRENGVARENSDRSLAHVGANLELPLAGSHRLSGSVAFLDGEQGVPPGLLDPVVRYWRFTVWRSLAASLGHTASYAGERLQLDELVYLRLFDNLLDSFDDATYSTQTSARAFHDWYHDQLAGGRVRARYRLPPARWGSTELRLWAGLEHDRHQDESDGVPLPEAITRTLLTFAPEAEAYLGERWSLLAAVQLDGEIPGSAPSGKLASRLGWGPLLSAGFDPLPGVSLRASVARRTRFPTLRDRFTQAQGSRTPNPELAPESAWHFGLDGTWRGPRALTVQLSFYDAEVQDLIDLVNIGGGMEQLQNFSAGRLLGCELSAEAKPWRWLWLRAGYAFLHARRSEPQGGSTELENRPAHKLTTEAGVSCAGSSSGPPCAWSAREPIRISRPAPGRASRPTRPGTRASASDPGPGFRSGSAPRTSSTVASSPRRAIPIPAASSGSGCGSATTHGPAAASRRALAERVGTAS